MKNQSDSGTLARKRVLENHGPNDTPVRLNDYFPLILCLNLKRRSDRWQQMQARFLTHQIEDVVCFHAIDGARVLVPDSWPSTPGAYGCLQSHVAIVEHARDLGVSSVLIFEDDVDFTGDFSNKLLAALKHLPDNWQLFFLGAIELEDPELVADGITRVKKAYSTFAYAIHHSVFEAFITLNKHSDQLLDINSFILQKNYHCYCASPYLAWVDSGYSDAQEKIENHWYLRESLVLFGQKANALLASSCVLIHLKANATPKALDNLYFLLEYYWQYFQGYLSVCVVEQGNRSQVELNRLTNNTRHLLTGDNNKQTDDFSMATAKLEQEFDYLVLSSNGLYLAPMDFRGNLQMCQRYQLTSGYCRQIRLSVKESLRLKENADGKGLDLSGHQDTKKAGSQYLGQDQMVRQQLASQSCYFFISTKLYLKLGKTQFNHHPDCSGQAFGYQSVNNVLVLSS